MDTTPIKYNSNVCFFVFLMLFLCALCVLLCAEAFMELVICVCARFVWVITYLHLIVFLCGGGVTCISGYLCFSICIRECVSAILCHCLFLCP